MANKVRVDDRDSSIHYLGGNWSLEGVKEEYLGTTHGTKEAGAQISFTFEGSAIGVYGTITNTRRIAAVSNYVIDGQSMFTLTAQPHTPILHQSLFYQSPKLGDGEHTLVVTSTVADSAFYFDFFDITPNVQKAPETSPSPDAAAPTPPPQDTQKPSTTTETGTTRISGDPGIKTTVVVQGVTVTLTPTSNPPSAATTDASPSASSLGASSSTSGRVPTGTIVGVAIGALTGILILVFLLWRFRERARRAKHSNEKNKISGFNFISGRTPPPVVPFASGGSAGQEGPISSYGLGYTTRGANAKEKHSLSSSQSLANSTTALVAAHDDRSQGSSSHTRPGLSRPSSPPQAVEQRVRRPGSSGVSGTREDVVARGSLLEDSPPPYQPTPANQGA
ncbi:hypothetical protein FPV67DRAFT_216406 [Lyophyllum atratum]|nr:hypothetical protein FPV67DRAFT_216406 [Lyophyllum atratum]